MIKVAIVKDTGGVSHYRQYQPLKALADRGLISVTEVPSQKDWTDDGVVDAAAKAILSSDILFIASPSTMLYPFLRSLKTNMSIQDKEYPRFVFDFDDDTLNLPATNQVAFCWLREEVDVVINGKQRELYRDGKYYNITINNQIKPIKYDVDSNLDRRDTLLRLYKLADYITTPSPFLASKLARYIDEPFTKMIRVCPNVIIPEEFTTDKPIPKKPGEIRIMWTLSSAHHNDWAMLRPAIGRVLRRHPEASLWAVGSQYGQGRDIPLSQLHRVPWQPLETYGKTLAEVAPDIGICWVTDKEEFSFSKSPLKWIEMTAIGAATICSCALYDQYLTHDNETLLCANPLEFEENLENLIKDSKLRQKLQKASDYTYREQYIPEAVVPAYMGVFSAAASNIKIGGHSFSSLP